MLKMADNRGYLPLHHAAANCLEMDAMKFLVESYLQARVTMCRFERQVPLHVLCECNFRPNIISAFLNDLHLHSMDYLDKKGSKFYVKVSVIILI